jgi:heterodisulfide reductase subunit C2
MESTSMVSTGVITFNTPFVDQVEALSHEQTQLCYHCHKCTAGCPVSAEMTYGPDRLLRLVHLGQKAAVLASPDIWLCLACETCGARCPNGINIAHVMDALRQMARAEGLRPNQPRVALFHDIFVGVIRVTGQMHEATLLGVYKVLSGDLFSDLVVGAQLFLKGKIPILPKVSRPGDMLKRVFEKKELEK